MALEQQIEKIKQEILNEVMDQVEAFLEQIPDKLAQLDFGALKENLVGPEGLQGERGFRGEPGEQGPAGKDGKDGATVFGMHGINGTDGQDGKDGRDGIDGRPGRDGKPGKNGKDGVMISGEQIIQKINSLPDTADKQIDALHIKNLISLIKKHSEVPSLGRRIGGGGITLETPTGTVNGVNTVFDVVMSPKYLVIDGVSKFEGVHYTITNSRITIIDGAPPVQFIRAII